MKKILYTLITFCAFAINSFAQAPTINSFTPTFGSIGTLVTITGTNLNNIDTVKIGGVAAIKISKTATTLVAMVMPGAITGNIYIANNSGNVISISNFTKTNSIAPNTQQGSKLLGTDAVGTAYQGWSVSLSADGNTAIVGGANDSSQRGAAWIYTKIGNNWTQQGSKLVGSGFVGNTIYQGWSVSLSADGNTAIVGGRSDSSSRGAAWIFIRTGNTWTQQGNKLVGTGSIGFSCQGSSVSLSADGNTAIVGGSCDSNFKGASWIFTRIGNTWAQQGNKLVGTGNIGASNQGTSVSISADGNTVLIGGEADSNNTGASWIFTRIGNTWAQQGDKLVGTGNLGNLYQGSSVSLSADGNTAIIGAPGISKGTGTQSLRLGTAWIFIRTGNTWIQQGNKLIVGAGNTCQGRSVSLSADGNIALIGANASVGSSWIFNRIGTVWTQQEPPLIGSENIGNSRQGSSVSISADGKTGVVGGFFDNDLIGATWVFISPSIISTIDTMQVFKSCFGYPSKAQFFTISGENLSSDSILIEAPASFEISKSLDSGYSANLKIVPNLGRVNNINIHVRIIATPSIVTSSGPKKYTSGNIVCSSPNSVSQNIAISGEITWFTTGVITKSNTICSAQGNGTATVNAQYGTPPYTYLWSSNANNQITQTATSLKEDIYFVTVTDDNKCSSANNPRGYVLNTPDVNIQVPITNIAMLDQSSASNFNQYYNYDLPVNIIPSPNNPQNYADAGKYFRFKIQSKNSKLNGQSIVNGFCKVRSNSPYLTITDSLAALNNIAYNGKVWSADEFEVYINPTTPKGSNLYLDFVVEESTTQFSTGCLSIPIAHLNYSPNTDLTIDDDNNPDSHGNNNDTCELGETIEFYPWLYNVSNYLTKKSVQYVKGTLLNNNNFAGVNIWNNTKGVNDTVMNSTWWNLAFGKPTSINRGSDYAKPAMDFVFDYSYGAPRNNFDLNLAVAAGFSLLSDTTLSLVQWSLPYNFKSEVGPADILQINPQTINNTSLGGINKVNITSNRSWVVNSNQSWVTLNKTSGLGNDSLYITIAANTGLPRTALLTFTAGLIIKTLTINQDSFTSADVLLLDKDSIMTSFGASLNTVQVSSNRSWTVSSNQSWCGVSTVSGSGNGSFNVINTINNTGLFRNALVTVTAGSITKNVYIGQSASLGINNTIINNQQISLFPNPNNGNFTIQLKNTADKNGTITIVDMLGRIVYETPYNLNGNDDTISISEMHLQAGTYSVIIGNKDGVTSRKSFVVVGE